MLTKEQVVKKTKAHGCELSLADLAQLWGTKAERGYLDDFRKEEETRDRNVRFALFMDQNNNPAFPKLPEMEQSAFASLKEYAQLAKDEILARVHEWARDNGLTASVNKVSGGMQFFDTEALQKLASDEKDEEPED